MTQYIFGSDNIEVCAKCGNGFKMMKQHKESCDRIPAPDELVAILDNDYNLTIGALSKRYKTGIDQIYDRLNRTKWNRENLRQRGKIQRYNTVTKRKRQEVIEMEFKPNKYIGWNKCPICQILKQPEEIICTYCQDEKRSIIITYELINKISPIEEAD